MSIACCWIYALSCTWHLQVVIGNHLQQSKEDPLPPPQEFCQLETFNVTCRPNEFILMTSARYGRMQVGRCVPVNYFVGCSVDVRDRMDALCSGRRHCSVTVSNRDLFRVQPCRKDLVAYLEASYRCVPVSGLSPFDSAPGPACEGQAIVTRQRSGYFASHATSSTGLGSERCPWLIEAKQGQRIRLTVRDLSDWRFRDSDDEEEERGHPGPTGGGGQSNDHDQCPAVAEFYENRPTTPVKNEEVRVKVRSCVLQEEKTLTHTSATNHLYVSIRLNNVSTDMRFYVHYEMIGCPDVAPPANAWLRRDGDRLLVKCNFTRERWHIVCNGHEWISTINNCSTTSSADAAIEIRNINDKLREMKPLPIGLLVAVSVGVVIGIAFGSLFLLLICFCVNRLFEKHESEIEDPERNVYKLLDLRQPRADLRVCRELTSISPEDKHVCRQSSSACHAFPKDQSHHHQHHHHNGAGDGVYSWQYVGLSRDRNNEHWQLRETVDRFKNETSTTRQGVLCPCGAVERLDGRKSPPCPPRHRCTCSSGNCIHQYAATATLAPTPTAAAIEARSSCPHNFAADLMSCKMQVDVDDDEDEEEEGDAEYERTANKNCGLEGEAINQSIR